MSVQYYKISIDTQKLTNDLNRVSERTYSYQQIQTVINKTRVTRGDYLERMVVKLLNQDLNELKRQLFSMFGYPELADQIDDRDLPEIDVPDELVPGKNKIQIFTSIDESKKGVLV